MNVNFLFIIELINVFLDSINYEIDEKEQELA